MSDAQIWRYLSLTKYIDLLRLKSLYFPKASLFKDDTEGKWWGHAYLYENAERWRPSPANVKILEDMLERAGHHPASVMREIDRLLNTQVNEWIRKMLRMARRGTKPEKRRAIIEDVISSWKKAYSNHSKTVEELQDSSKVYRESTYLSCWNAGHSMSLAMWEMYGGKEAVAVRSSKDKLASLMKNSAPLLEQKGMVGGFTEIVYIDGLKNPSKEVMERLDDIVFQDDRDINIGLFSIKASLFSFEQEVRGIIYPEREFPGRGSFVDPHPNMSGISLPIVSGDSNSIDDFIEMVYVHPLLTEDSLPFKAVKELNRLFGLEQIPVVADRIEAMGADIVLPLVE